VAALLESLPELGVPFATTASLARRLGPLSGKPAHEAGAEDARLELFDAVVELWAHASPGVPVLLRSALAAADSEVAGSSWPPIGTIARSPRSSGTWSRTPPR